jgi:hypothetical protein
MQWEGSGAVRYRLLPGHDTRLLHDEDDELVDPVDFLARVLMHVPEPRRHRVRYYGAYSNASHGKRRRAALGAGEVVQSPECSAAPDSPQEDGDESSVEGRLVRRRWRELIKRIFEVDPLVGPRCQAEMRIVAFILDHEVIDTILRHLARKKAERDRAPPGCPDGEDASHLARVRSDRGAVCSHRAADNLDPGLVALREVRAAPLPPVGAAGLQVPGPPILFPRPPWPSLLELRSTPGKGTS